MKKTLIVSSIIAAGLVAAAPAWAQEANTASVQVTGPGAANATVQVRMLPRPDVQPGQFRAYASTTRAQVRAVRSDMRAYASTTRGDIKDLRQDVRATATSTQAKRMDLKAEIENRKEDLASRRASTTAAIKETVQSRVAQTLKMAADHLSQEMARLSEIKSKIDTRLDKFDASGANTSVARADLSLAVAAIESAQASVDATAGVQITSDLKASSDSIREAAKNAQTAIDAAQQALTKVVSDMKALLPMTATSSASVQ